MKVGKCPELYFVKFVAKSNQMEPRTVVFSDFRVWSSSAQIVVNFGLFVINVNAYFSITAKTFQGKGLTVTSYFDIFCLLVLEYITGIRDGFPIILSKIMIIYWGCNKPWQNLNPAQENEKTVNWNCSPAQVGFQDVAFFIRSKLSIQLRM